MKDATLHGMRAPETAKRVSRSALAIAAARAQHLEATRATESLTALFISTLELRATHARFAAHFVRLLDLKAACVSAGIGYETGRTYIKKLFVLTNSKNQVELAAILICVARR